MPQFRLIERDHGAQGTGRLSGAAGLYRTEGTAVAVTDEELLAAQATVAQAEGAFVCPEGAACFAAVRQLRTGVG